MSKFKLSHFFPECQRDGFFDVLGIIDSVTDLPMLTYINSSKYIESLLKKRNVRCVLTNHELYQSYFKDQEYGVVVCEDPRNAFFQLHNQMKQEETYKRKEFETVIGENCHISNLACIAGKNVRIGNNVTIEEFVSIKDNVTIGDNSIIRAGTIIGGSGFEFKKDDGKFYRVEHLGGVKIGDDVEIQYNCAVDKALFPWDDTIIGNHSKLDNLIHIGHAVKIGENVLMPALSVIGGRVEIKDNAWIGIGSVIRNGITIGNNARTNMGAVVTKNVSDNEAVSGNFAIEHSKFISKLKKES